MATDSILGLFTDPYQYMQQQNQAQNTAATQFAQLTPMQQAQYGLYKGGSQLGGAFAGAMGIQDPALQRQSQRRAFLQQIDMSSPDSLVQAIKASSNDPELNAYLMGKYKELTGIQKEQSVIRKNEAWEASKTDSEKKRTLLSDVEQKLADGQNVEPGELNRAKLAYAQETKPKTFQQPTGEIVTVPGIDVNLFPNLGKVLTSGGAGGGTKMAGVIETPASIEAKQKGVDAATSAISGIDDSLNAVKGIRDLRAGSLSTNPWLVNTMKNYPTAAMAQEGLVKTITAGKVIDTIAEMKQQSKTGATGFGALNGRELDQLEAKARLLNPQSPTFEADLKYIEDKLLDSKNKIQADLSKKKAALPAANWQNPQGNAGRIAILNAELAKATNPADIAGLKREIASLGGTPSLKLESQQSFESKILKTLKASGLEDTPKNREAAIKALNEAGHK